MENFRDREKRSVRDLYIIDHASVWASAFEAAISSTENTGTPGSLGLSREVFNPMAEAFAAYLDPDVSRRPGQLLDTLGAIKKYELAADIEWGGSQRVAAISILSRCLKYGREPILLLAKGLKGWLESCLPTPPSQQS